MEFIVAMLTPLTSRNEVDPERFAAMVEFLRQRGVTGILPSGTTGEFASLSLSQRRRLFDLAARERQNLWFLAGAGCTNLPETLDLISSAADCGAHAALIIPPFYFRDAGPAGLTSYFEKLLEFSRLPVAYYHIPQNSGITGAPQILAPLARHEKLIGVKDSSGDKEGLKALIQGLPGKKIWVGTEAFLVDALKMGAFGGVSALSNVFPHLVRETLDLFRAGQDPSEAQSRVAAARTIVNRYVAIPALRFLLSKLGGIDPGPPLPPLAVISEAEGMSLLEELRKARII